MSDRLQDLIYAAAAVTDSWTEPWLAECVSMLDGKTSAAPTGDDPDYEAVHAAARAVVEHWSTGMLAENVEMLDETIDEVVVSRSDLVRPTPDED